MLSTQSKRHNAFSTATRWDARPAKHLAMITNLRNLGSTFVAAALFGCLAPASAIADEHVAANSNPGDVQSAVTAEDFRRLVFKDTDEVRLMSHNGEWEGADNDLELHLRRDGTARITWYGYNVHATAGKFALERNGTIVITPKREVPWLPMPWAFCEDKLVIKAPGKEILFDAARAAGVPESELTQEAHDEEYEQWPLRQVPVRQRD